MVLKLCTFLLVLVLPCYNFILGQVPKFSRNTVASSVKCIRMDFFTISLSHVSYMDMHFSSCKTQISRV